MNQAHKSPCLCVFVYVSWYTPLPFFLLLWPYVSVTLVCLWPKYLKEANVKDKTCILAHGFSKGSLGSTFLAYVATECQSCGNVWRSLPLHAQKEVEQNNSRREQSTTWRMYLHIHLWNFHRLSAVSANYDASAHESIHKDSSQEPVSSQGAIT